MISAVDSSVILDVLTDDARFAEPSLGALRMGAQQGKLIVCECVIAEVFPALSDTSKLEDLLADWGLVFVPSTKESAVAAGGMFAAYLKRPGEKKKVIVDFLIGAHALVHADRLIARDRGYFRDYFKALRILDPSVQLHSRE